MKFYTIIVLLIFISQSSFSYTSSTNNNQESIKKYNTTNKLEFKKNRIGRMLSELDVSKEDRKRIIVLQKKYKREMLVNGRKNVMARKRLIQLQNKNANEQQINSVIDELADIQKEMLHIIVNNKREMKKILGDEKYKVFMSQARSQYKKRKGKEGRMHHAPSQPVHPELTP